MRDSPPHDEKEDDTRDHPDEVDDDIPPIEEPVGHEVLVDLVRDGKQEAEDYPVGPAILAPARQRERETQRPELGHVEEHVEVDRPDSVARGPSGERVAQAGEDENHHANHDHGHVTRAREDPIPGI